jgi:hypothetical protein
VDHGNPVAEGGGHRNSRIKAIQAELLGRPRLSVGGSLPFPGADAGGFLRQTKPGIDRLDCRPRVLSVTPCQNVLSDISRRDQHQIGRLGMRNEVKVPPRRCAGGTACQGQGTARHVSSTPQNFAGRAGGIWK